MCQQVLKASSIYRLEEEGSAKGRESLLPLVGQEEGDTPSNSASLSPFHREKGAPPLLGPSGPSGLPPLGLFSPIDI